MQEIAPGVWEAAGNYKILVPTDSAINSHSLDLPENAIPIPQSHSELVKFPNGQDADYHYVLNHLKDFRTASVGVVKERFLMQPRNPQLLSTLHRLAFPESRGTDTTRQSGQSNLDTIPPQDSPGMFNEAVAVAKHLPASTIRLFKETSGKAASGTPTPAAPGGSNMSRQQRAEDVFPIRLRTDDLGPFGRFDNALRRGPDHTDNMYSEEDTQSLDKFLIREAYKKKRETNSNIQQLIRRTQKDSIRELGKLHKIPGVGVYSHSSIRGGYVIGGLITICLNLRNNSRVYVFVLSAPHSMRKCLFAGLQRSTGK
jgi:hypothetical protein